MHKVYNPFIIHLFKVVVGDQLTCKVIRGCKEWRQSESDIKERLAWVNETPGKFMQPDSLYK